jgi:hypothetical protein
MAQKGSSDLRPRVVGGVLGGVLGGCLLGGLITALVAVMLFMAALAAIGNAIDTCGRSCTGPPPTMRK